MPLTKIHFSLKEIPRAGFGDLQGIRNISMGDVSVLEKGGRYFLQMKWVLWGLGVGSENEQKKELL